MIRSLQTLRAVGALMIMAHHFGFDNTFAEAFGDCAVCLFMMLSGFVLGLAYATKRDNLPSTGRFMANRISRFYPLYFVTLAAMLVLTKFGIPPLPLVCDILLIQSWVPDPTYYFSGNAPAWFLSSILFSYLLFLPALRLMAHRRPYGILCAVILSVYIAALTAIPGQLATALVYIFPPMQFPPFLIGMTLGTYYATNDKSTKHHTQLKAITAIALWIAAIWAWRYIPEKAALGIWWWMPTALLIMSLCKIDGTGTLLDKTLSSKWPVALGNVSFSFYILHIPYIFATRIIMNKLSISMPLGLEFIISAATLALISAIVSHGFERPAARFIMSLGK